jgi:hypothetical protein
MVMLDRICPRCGRPMLDRLVHSSGIVVCELKYLEGMWAIQHAEDKGKSAHRHLGNVAPIISMMPDHEQKYARCLYCEKCILIVLSADDIVPSEQVPQVAR